MPIALPADIVSPLTAWATVDQFRCNEKTRCGGSPCPENYVSPWSAQDWLDWSTTTLFHLSGSRFAVRTLSVSPKALCGCVERSLECTSGCGTYPTIDLGQGALTVASVIDDGGIVDDSLYRLDDHRWLVRTAELDGTNPGWPSSHRHDLNSGPGTFIVTYTTGAGLPPGAAQACVALACALRQYTEQSENPGVLKGQSVTSVSTRGVSAQTEGLLKGLRTGKSGVGAVDAFLAVWLVKTEDTNGRNIAPGGVVWSPDLDDEAPKRTTWLA